MAAEQNSPATTGKPAPKKRGSKPASLEANSTASREDMRKAMGNILHWHKCEMVKSDEECAERLDEFFARVAETGEIPTVEKMCLALGAARQTVWEWEQGKRGQVRADLIKRAKGILAALDAELAATGKIPQVVYIFRSKNFYGMKDQQEHVVTGTDPFGEQKSAEELHQKYIDAVVVDDPE